MVKKGKRENKKSFLGRLVNLVFKITVAFFALAILFVLSIQLGYFGKLPSRKVLKNIQHQQATQIVDKNEATIGVLFRVYRSNVEYEELPQHLIDALIATEDARFYKHNGIDYRSLGRVLIKTIIQQDRSAGGGSTITQQLAKNLFPRDINSKFDLVIAKMKELVTAREIESLYSKEEIILLYLNTVNFPDNTFGIGAAAQTFFSKKVNQLSLTESAILVGSLKANHTYNPRLFPEKSLARRNIVLSQMLKYEKIDEATFTASQKLPILLNYSNIQPNYGVAGYFREQVRKELVQWADDYEEKKGKEIDIYGDGLIIHTTLDKELQDAAEESMTKHLVSLQKVFEKEWGNGGAWNKYQVYSRVVKASADYKRLAISGKSEKEIMQLLAKKEQRNLVSLGKSVASNSSFIDSVKHSLKQLQSGFVAMDARSGDIRAYIGGVDFKHFKYDHVIQSKRQVGSTFKPFIYAAALEGGMDPCNYFAANAVSYSDLDGWTPVNGNDEEDKYLNVTMEEALRRSMNTVSVKVLEETGIEDAIEIAHKAGITSELPEVPSLALGTAQISMMELASAYTSFLNEGKYFMPRLITKITDPTGKVLAEFDIEESKKRAFDKETAAMMLHMMQTVVNKGTASRIRWKYKIKSDIAGKTGTTQHNRDGWFVGLTPDLVSVSWVGADNGAIGFRSTAVGQGANSALPIYAGFIKALEADSKLKGQYLSDFPELDAKLQLKMNCPPTKEDGLLKKIFSNKHKERDFNEEGKQNTNIFKRIKKLFN
ncbi:MAG: penicillin-binding protein 1A [Marivirga sp.]|jgi:penicillin-binding protein 1A